MKSKKKVLIPSAAQVARDTFLTTAVVAIAAAAIVGGMLAIVR